MTIPLGDYYTNQTLNISGNRWADKIESNLTYRIRPKTILEIAGSSTFFSDNDEYGSTNKLLERKPLYALESHISHDLNKQLRGSLSYFYHGGGETIINNAEQDNARSDHSAQVGINWKFTPSLSAGARFRSNFSVENSLLTILLD